MEKKKSFGRRLEDFFAGKGFYIVLFLCAAVIGVSAWALLTSTGTDVDTTPAIEIPSADNNTGNDLPAAVTDPMEPVTVPDDIQDEPVHAEAPETVEDEPQEAPVWAPEPESAPVADVWVWPLNGDIDVPYSMTALVYNSTMADWRTHNGVDLAAELGAQVSACAAGTVESVYDDAMHGTTVVIDHLNGVRSVYSNLAAQPTVLPGDSVVAGEVIGAVGQTTLCETGQVTHLHFAMTRDGASIDPAEYMPDR